MGHELYGEKSASCSFLVVSKESASPLNEVDCDWALDRTHEVP